MASEPVGCYVLAEPFANRDEIKAKTLKMRPLQANEANELHKLRTFLPTPPIEAIVRHRGRPPGGVASFTTSRLSQWCDSPSPDSAVSSELGFGG